MENEYRLLTHPHAEHELLQAQPQKLRTLLVDDSVDFLTAICAVLEQDEAIDVIGTARNGIEAIQAVADLHPELVLMDVRMPCMDGVTAASLVSRLFPATDIVLMSAEDSHQLRLACREAGADGFVAKSRFGKDLAHVLQALHDKTTSIAWRSQ